jgi:hypothetical protein
MAARKKSAKKGAKRAKKAVRKAAPARAAKRAKARPARKAPRKASGRKAAATKAKARKGAPRKAAPKASAPRVTETITSVTLANVQVEPLRLVAADALLRGEAVQLVAGTSEDGLRVETLVFAPSGTGVQSSGTYVHRGEWNGERLVTDKGHLLDPDGACFCRDCEMAGGYCVDDDE